ncbi:hypothetical protein TRFO_17981 [Tritrichomonas foetus]|uniref:Uncharacterized protein n=1 Tax=Tritrichomonas foetus TaxID=1144522 RepID=A0A1J4KRJ2_9EUKA|nr:hypothetical protein TRFO_17981 [Tritrichomonas foetus]|eukprot:OHT12286.1 hypothetical protein TRFO_17981 [Tritrichomonas foetus]
MSIADITIPDDLPEVQRAEFVAYQKAMIDLEIEWNKLQNNENTDQKACIDIIQEQHERKKKKITERHELRKDIIQKQYQKETDRIDREFRVAKTTLNERLIRAYYQSDQNITAQLKDLKGKDFAAYIQENAIDFPQMPPDTQMMTRTKQPEEVKIRLSSQECDRDLRRIQSIFESEE